MKRIQTYSAPGITVTFDPNKCIHSAVCLMRLPRVFDVRRRRWVAPEAASVEEVAATIDRCPSGALQYKLEGKQEKSAVTDEAITETFILTSTNGPLLIEGNFELLDAQGKTIQNHGRAALCRCGGSSNKPFCDGSHKVNGFRSS